MFSLNHLSVGRYDHYDKYHESEVYDNYNNYRKMRDKMRKRNVMMEQKAKHIQDVSHL